MTKKLWLALALASFGIGELRAQVAPSTSDGNSGIVTLPPVRIGTSPPPTLGPQVQPPSPAPPAQAWNQMPDPPYYATGPRACSAPAFWFNVDALYWWMPRTSIPVPLVTTGDPADGNLAGVVGRPSTRILFGDQSLANDNFGMRLALGGSFGGDRAAGFELGGFWFARAGHAFRAASDANGNPPIYLTAYNVQTAAEASLVVADPLAQFGGNVTILTKMRLWGAEGNLSANIVRDDSFEWTLLYGFRFIQLAESFDLYSNSVDLAFNQAYAIHDRFATTNNFYGFQIGSRFRWQPSRVSFEATPKLAIGATERILKIDGSSSNTGPDAVTPGNFAGGFLAEPSNIGRRSSTAFGIVPSLELKLGLQVSEHVHFSLGYDILYLNSVLRPGNQLDRNINLSQNPIYNATPGTGPNSPASSLNSSSFFVNGINLRLEFRF